MPMPIRRRNATMAVKFETAQGVDAFGGAAPAAATDFIKADFNPSWTQQQIANPELTGTLDDSASIAGGTKVTVDLTLMLKGSGAANVAPQWGKLLQLCAMVEAVSPGIAAAAATAGTVSTATLGAGYAATAQAYRGMPAVLGTNPAGGEVTVITDYTAGRVATFGHSFAAPLDGTTTVQIPPHVLYRPTSDVTAQKSGTVVLFQDGLAWKLLGCQGSWKIEVDAGGIGKLTVSLTGMYTEPYGATPPAGIVFDGTQPPVFRDGMSRLNGNLARISKASFDGGLTVFQPENPEALEGFDPPIITKRNVKGNFDPLMSVSETIARVAAFKSGVPQTVGIAYGNTPGNRIGIMSPRAQYTGFGMTNRSDLMAENLPFECAAPDASIFVVAF